MAINTDNVQRLYVAYFNRPSDPVGQTFWESQLSSTTAANQAQLTTLAAGFSGSAEYLALTAGQTSAQLVNNLYINLFGRAAETAGLNFWAARLAAGTETVASIALQLTFSAQGTDAIAIANKLAAANTFTTALDTTAEITGYSGTAAAAAGRSYLAPVTDVASTLTTAQAGVNAAVIAATAAGTAATGSTFTLTTSIDNFTGTSSNDTFIGDINTTSAADQIVGSGGTDTLKLFGITSAVSPAFSGIETVVLEGQTAGGFDVSAKTDVTSLQLVNPTTAQTYTTAQGQAISLATVDAAETNTFAGNTVTSLALALNGVASTGADATIALTGTALTSLAITTSTAASQVTLTNTGAALTTVTVAGDKALELGSALTTITTINASTSTGGVDIDAIGASKLAFTGGTGNDRINMGATLAANDVIVGGTGTDTLAIDDADTLTALLAVGVSGFEILEASAADATAFDVDTIITNNTLTGILVSSSGGNATVNNINSGAINNISFTGDAPTTVVLTGKGFLSGGTTDAATVILNNSVADNADGVDIATSLTFTQVDKLTVNATSDDTTAARAILNSVAALTATDLDNLVITGNAAVSITTAATTAAVQEVDASGSTGAVTFIGTASPLATLIYRGNSNVDTVTAIDAATNAVTLFTGGGSDVLNLGVTGATHALNFTATDFTTGDVRAGNAITINTGNAFQAADTVTLNFSSAVEALLKSGGTALNAASANVVLVGTAFSATTNVIAVDGGNNTTLQFDLNGDGTFTAAADFSIELLGLANNTLNYIAATDLFTFTATA